MGCGSSDYVRNYFDVQNRAYLCNFMRDFSDFYAQFLFANQAEHNRCENRAFSGRNMRDFLFLCAKSRIARP